MRKEIQQSILVQTRQKPIVIGLSNRANFTSPAVTRNDSPRAHASSGSARSSQSSVYSSQLSTSEREQIVQDEMMMMMKKKKKKKKKNKQTNVCCFNLKKTKNI